MIRKRNREGAGREIHRFLLRYVAAVLVMFAGLWMTDRALAAGNFHGKQLYFGMGGDLCALNTQNGKVSTLCEILKTKYNPIGDVCYAKGKLYFTVDLAAAAGDEARHQRVIYCVGAGGKGKKRLAAGYAPQVVKNKVYYIAERYNKKTGVGKSTGLYRMNLDGSGKEAVTIDDVRDFAIVGNTLYWLSSEGKNPSPRETNYNRLYVQELTDKNQTEFMSYPACEICDYDENNIHFVDFLPSPYLYSLGKKGAYGRKWGIYNHCIPDEIDMFSDNYKKDGDGHFIGYQNDCYVYRMGKQWKLFLPETQKITLLKGVTGHGEQDRLVAAGGGWMVLTHPAKSGTKTAMSVIRTNGKKCRTIYTWK